MDGLEYVPKQSSPCQKDYIPPSCSRLPPDGHEFDLVPTKPASKLPTDPSNCLSPPLTKQLKQKITFDSKKVTIESSKYPWRNDEKSEKSVKDKIAMFSNVQTNAYQNQTVKQTRKLSSSKLTEQETMINTYTETQYKEKNDQAVSKKISLPYQSLFDVSTNFDQKDESIKNEITQSTLDLSDITLSNKVLLNKDYSTLPRKSSDIPKDISDGKHSGGNTTLSRAYSFSGESKLHNRSQSLVDVASKNNFLSKQSDDLRRSSLAALTEQRKKNFSKLRGLVIPEKVVEVPSLVVDDLPIIKSNDCLIANNLDEEKPISIKPDLDKLSISNNKPPTEKPCALIPSSLWKAENNYEIPKYSPAFKRKSLTLYGTSSSVSSVSSSLSSSREELRACFYESKNLSNANTNISKSLANLSRNPFSSQSEPKSLESITSPSISDLSYEYGNESVSPNLNTCNEVLSRFKYNEGYGSDTQRSKGEEGAEEESDNDSAVSSSRSSISPPHSPLSSTKKHQSATPPLKNNRFDLKLKRTLSSETTASNSSNGSTLTSGSHASSSGSTCSTENKRVLKAQSVEAINRKNVLSSARYSSGINTEIKTDMKTEISESDDNDDDKQNENELKTIQTPITQDLSINFEKENNSLQFSASSPVNNTICVNKSGSPFESYNSSPENDLSKHHTHSNELIKGETSFNIDNFTYSSHKGIDKNSNVKTSDLSDDTDGLLAPRWQGAEHPPEYTPTNKHHKSIPPQVETPKTYDKQKDDLPSPKTINVNNMKKVFEKVDNSYLTNARFKINQNIIQHPRVSSVDSTNSDDSCVPNPSHYGSASNLLREQQFGSITSLASSTSLISQQELSQLIEEANHTLEDEGNAQEVVVVILHRDIPGGSIGITLAGGADYEAKEITVHKVLIGSPAERDGRIQKGDRILSINGKSMKGQTHYESLAILKAPRPEVVLVVSRQKGDTAEDGTSLKTAASIRMTRYLETKALNQTKGKDIKWGPSVNVTLIKDGAGLGFSLEGGKDSPYGDQPLTIKKIFTGGCAEKSGNLFAGDELLLVNNMDVSELSRIEAWSLMKRLPDGEVHLSVRHPFT